MLLLLGDVAAYSVEVAWEDTIIANLSPNKLLKALQEEWLL